MILTINPANGEALERLPFMGEREVDAKLEASARAAQAWSNVPVSERAALLTNVAKMLREQRDVLAMAAVREMGKPVVQARAEIEKCAWCCEFFAERGAGMLADVDAPSGASRSYVAFRPLGTLLAIMPWNFPYWQVFRAAAPAIVAGNAVVLKHAENTTRCGLEIERIFAAAGTPEGLFTTLLVTNEEIDERIADPRISAVTLTGSERAGTIVAAAAGRALKKCVLELGGSDAFVVLADADLDAAATTAATARFQNNGQSCIAAKRFIVEAPVYDEFLQRFVDKTRAMKIGDPADETTQIGPIARADLLKTLHDQVQDTLARGATIACGGHPLEGKGNYYEPTIVGEVVPGMRLFDEETFGPAAAVVRASNSYDAIALANRSSYGLGFSIWTRDSAAAERIAPKVEAGAVFINGMVASDPRLPFGGIKKSGYGRELSVYGVHEFVNVQTVWVA